MKKRYQYTSQAALRRAFWHECGNLPGITRKKIPNYSRNGKMHNTDTRRAWCDWLDAQHRAGLVSDALAWRAIL